MKTPDRVVIALGGNALASSGEGSPSVLDEATAAAAAFDMLAPLFESVPHLLITHGNGPQVGTLMLRAELSTREAGLPRLPLDSLVADTAGGIGYLLAREVRNALLRHDVGRSVATVLTQTVVEPCDADSFKPVGPVCEEGERALNPDHRYGRQPDGRLRRVVSSPPPLLVLELDAIAALFDSGIITIAGGGGGVAVCAGYASFDGVEVVVDKDLTSSLLARSLNADLLLILTNVDAVRVDFNTPQERRLERTNVLELRELQQAGAFGEGSMAPKVVAAAAFAESAIGRRAVICDLHDVEAALNGRAGTQVVHESAITTG